MLQAFAATQAELKHKNSTSRFERELHRRRLVDAVVRRGSSFRLGMEGLQVGDRDWPSGRSCTFAPHRLGSRMTTVVGGGFLSGVGEVERRNRRCSARQLVRPVKEAAESCRVCRLQECLRECDNLLLCLCKPGQSPCQSERLRTVRPKRLVGDVLSSIPIRDTSPSSSCSARFDLALISSFSFSTL